jgi:hypothetical protein
MTMKTTLRPADTALLTEFSGAVRALCCAPTLQPSANLAAWTASYFAEGLAIGKSRAEAESLRRLENAALVRSGSGATQGRRFRLTLAGAVNAATRFAETDSSHLRKMLNDVLRCIDQSDTTVPRSDVPLLLGFEIIASAGDWWELASKSDQAWRRYQLDLARVNGWIWPLLALGYLDRLASRDGFVWGLTATPTGREAVATAWPSPTSLPSLSEDELFASWRRGFDSGLRRFATTGPAAFASVVERCLPASRWY